LFRQIAPRYGLTPTIVPAPLCEANTDLATGHQCISINHKTRVTKETLLALSRAGVAYLSTRSIGDNHIPVRYAQSIGIAVGTVAYSPDSVADYTLMLMLMAARNAKVTVLRAATHDYRLPDAPGKELRDLTVGIVGTGRIGAAVLDRLRGFGCQLLAHDDRRQAPARYVPLEELLARSDIVSLHTPLTSDTHHLLNGPRIRHMKQGAFVINTGRGALVDTEALTAALECGRLGGAALDVVEGEEGVFYADGSNEPVAGTLLSRLQALPNVLISPHTAYYTDHSLRDMVEGTVVNCLDFERMQAAWIG
jgi:D-specific alpha-keto acid dehydrogenase